MRRAHHARFNHLNRSRGHDLFGHVAFACSANARAVVRGVVTPHRVGNPRKASCQCDDSEALAPPHGHPRGPRPERGGILARRAHDAPRGFDQEITRPRIPRLGKAAARPLVTRTPLARYETEIRFEVMRRRKARDVVRDRDDRTRRQYAKAGRRGE